MTSVQAPEGLTATQEKALAAVTEHPGATAKEIAAFAGIGASTAGKALAVLENHGVVHREHGEQVGARRTADRWHHRPSQTAPETSPTADEVPDGDGETDAAEEPSGPRLARGALRKLVLEYLTAHPDEAVTGPRVAKRIGRSAGAVANALAKLTAEGHADLVGESPRRYRLAGQ